MAGTIICYGDSNTYGYDARPFLGARFPEETRWPEILHARTDWNVKNCGQNGRCIPRYSGEIQAVCGSLRQWSRLEAPVWLWIMLGTNDVLRTPGTTAGMAAERMEHFLRKLTECEEIAGGTVRLRLISPVHLKPGVWVESDDMCRESVRLDDLYRKIAADLEIAFTCAGKWDIPVLFDGVHFSEEGHRKFAECVMREGIIVSDSEYSIE
ncbi:MAG: GDSL-type esterase/lipase family protein [Lachnospiraceae bacterium]|nr:GDSL-type esterase/lipase family protein [Lachnospiraceae bacterium]